MIGLNRELNMNGINYVTDEKGKPVAVQIDLKKYGAVWEDFMMFLRLENANLNQENLSNQ